MIGKNKRYILWIMMSIMLVSATITNRVSAKYLDEETIANIVEKAVPAVVFISTTTTVKNESSISRRFFEEFFGIIPDRQDQERVIKGFGSGFFVDKEGYIITNSHVIDGASSLEVTITGEKEPLKAKVVGQDSRLDLAILKLENPGKKAYPYLELGDSDKLRLGQMVIAIGHPLGLQHTVTTGVISSTKRDNIPVRNTRSRTVMPYFDLIQTDAAINPGNSGGPLLNLYGEVVGVNTLVSQGSQGIGFAIPSAKVREMMRNLDRKNDKLVIPWIGVQITNLDESYAKAYQIESGVYILAVTPDSPAAKAGLERGMIIQEVNTQKLNAASPADKFVELIRQSKIGEKVKLVIYDPEQKKIKMITVEVGQKPEDQ